MSTIIAQNILLSSETTETDNFVELDDFQFLQYDLPTPARGSNKCMNILGYIIGSFAFYVLSLVPMSDLIIDIRTIILFYDASQYVIVSKTLFSISLFFMFLLMHSYLISFVATSKKCSSIFFPDSNFIVRISHIIPFVGSPIANCFVYNQNQQSSRNITFHRFCGWFCFELLMIIGIIITPFIMFYLILQNYYLISKDLYVKLKSINMTNEEKELNTTIYQINKFVIIQRAQCKQQNTLLKMNEVLFEAIPQLILQSYVFTKCNDIYKDSRIEILFLFSISVKFLAILRAIYIIIENSDRRRISLSIDS